MIPTYTIRRIGQYLEQIKKSPNEVLNQWRAVKDTNEFKELLSREEKIYCLEERWNSRRYNKFGLQMMQGIADCYIVGQLKKRILNYNGALDQYRLKYQATPIVLFRLYDEPLISCVTEDKGIELIKLSCVKKVQPILRRGMYVGSKDSFVCGFCGVDLDLYNEDNFNIMGYENLSKSYVEELICGKDKCMDMGVAVSIMNLQEILQFNQVDVDISKVLERLFERERQIRLKSTQAEDIMGTISIESIISAR